ncbi:MAG TPA: hypothetical protein VNV63_05035, partial [Nitrospiria bacterium]|nr:hypothetical protein [Nitrospiria bacterium]
MKSLKLIATGWMLAIILGLIGAFWTPSVMGQGKSGKFGQGPDIGSQAGLRATDAQWPLSFEA